MSNAIKYSPPYTTIEIACVTGSNNAHVTVKDEGMGIRLQDQAKFFDRFYQVEGQETSP
ncbi:cell wall metabolism sensor histidine kinase WalK [Mucilaginibacter robiniae]|uniref:histidine kinase n=1 Tax=Mucilaginibacter robiniae TaxID=2728022 RepID=A0A7L5E6Z8_9SPHI|nr:cell wall metabolism sensor histidine kinase WalK [Mucilaginibacter robiniae]